MFTNLKNKYKNWKYKNTALLILSLVVLFYFTDTDFVRRFIASVGNLGYLGAFFVGIFFVSTFTVAPAAVVLFHLASTLHPIELALFAGLGAVAGDFIIFRFVKDKVTEELSPLFHSIGGAHVHKLFHTPYFAWFIPIIGAIIIASPLPDEIGVSILGISKMKTWQFLLLSFFLNAVGIFIIVTIVLIL